VEKGETDLIQLEINTADASPRKQPQQQISHAAQQEVAQPQKNM